MPPKDRYQERQLTAFQWFWFLLVMGVITRFPLLRHFSAENTDTILDLIYFDDAFVSPQQFYILPGHPFLLKIGTLLGWNGILWGRVLSAVAGILFLVPLWRLVRRWVDVETAGIVCVFALFSPLLWIWSIKAMGDIPFLLAFWWSVERLSAAWIESDSKAWWEACISTALASLMRPEGFVLFPWILYANERRGREVSWMSRSWLVICWCLPFWFLAPRLKVVMLAYQEGLGLAAGARTVSDPFFNFIVHWQTYITEPVYVFTPILFFLSALGICRLLLDATPPGDFFRKVLLPVFTILLISRLIPTAYQDRHLLIFLPLVLTAAGIGLESFFRELPKKEGSWRWIFLKNGLVTVGLIYLVVFSAAVMIYQNDSFGDVKRSAEFLKNLPADAVIYSDELPKTRYWAGRKVQLLDYSQHPFRPNKNEYVLLHSFYTQRVNEVGQTMSARFGAAMIHSDSSCVVPILTDLMENTWLQNRPVATAFRFEPQYFTSMVYRIDGKKD